MATPNLNLPLFSRTDPIDLVQVYNNAMGTLDTKVSGMDNRLTLVKDTADAANSTASSAQSAAAAAQSTATTAQTTATRAETAVEAVQSTVDDIAAYVEREGVSDGVYYRIWSNGIRELWGNKQCTFNGNGGGKATVTFPTACRFSNYENYNVFLQLMGTSDSAANDFNSIQVTSVEMKTSGFTIYGWNTSANTRYYRVAFHVIGTY